MCSIEDPCCSFAHVDLMDTMTPLNCHNDIVCWKDTIEQMIGQLWNLCAKCTQISL